MCKALKHAVVQSVRDKVSVVIEMLNNNSAGTPDSPTSPHLLSQLFIRVSKTEPQ